MSTWQRLRRAKWAHIITVAATGLAAIAAIGGLWAQAVATYWSQQTAKDQLSQSKQQSEQEARAQARAVSYWLEGNRGETFTLHLQNRSPDPVPWITLVLDRTVVALKGTPGPQKVRYTLTTTRLAPCTELVYSKDQLLLAVERPGGSRWVSFIGLVGDVQQAFIRDRDGKGWKRTANSLVPWSGILPNLNEQLKKGEWSGAFYLEPKAKKAVACDGAG
ncbi:hypothetical protein [Streptomyces sp. NPDC046862]|uniref:hypothetical protein n=1 Tax=Streptomyces sp. NPDC046862 TaxID=3154603 RepID=UPI00345259B4